MKTLAAALLLSLAAVGCLSHNVPQKVVSAHAAADLGCEEKKLALHQTDDLHWRVLGCDKEGNYQCRTTEQHPDGICSPAAK